MYVHCTLHFIYVNTALYLYQWVAFTFQLLWTMLLWTFVYNFLYGHIFSFLLGGYLEMGLLCHLRNCQTVSKVVISFYTAARNVLGFCFFHILANACYCLSFLHILPNILANLFLLFLLSSLAYMIHHFIIISASSTFVFLTCPLKIIIIGEFNYMLEKIT